MASVLSLVFLLSMTACGTDSPTPVSSEETPELELSVQSESVEEEEPEEIQTPEGFFLITGGTFDMGSPDS